MQQRGTRRGTRERHKALLDLLRQGTTHVDELASALGVSASTVRRDLGRLNADRIVARTYGGAVIPEAFHERPIEESARTRLQAKGAIAVAARPLVSPGATVFIDAGTTCAALARLIAEHDWAGDPPVVVTRGLETATILASSDQVDVVILGGRIRRLSHGVVGPLTDLALDRLSFSVAFLGADAVDPARGIGEPTLEETAVKERIAAHSQRVAVLADSSKLAVSDAPAWTTLPPAWTLVTDSDAPAELERSAGDSGVTVLVAGRS
ncbi:DeoR/GlpR family DNA-binding transcription regulator [Phytoactinopolyspora alkaliphila]|uniref:DeoR/GlpR family DNA-binding transcription regulator n=1 Tax=Phytoactinopolyspora alkaliphila TaxID=1783498 RepID=UPI001C207F85